MLAALVVVGLALAACSRSESKSTSQVAVKVNGDELTVHQVNGQLSRLGNVPEAKREESRKQVVEGLIGQQLLVSKAIESKLDRDPQVLAALEQSRAQILSQAYLQKQVDPKTRPAEADVKKYFDEHPSLFSQRRVYRLQELATNVPPARVAELEKVVREAKQLDQVVAWLRAKDFKVAANTALRGAEQLPLSHIEKIAVLKDGEMTVLKSGAQVTVLRLVASQSQPMTLEQAKSSIEGFLSAKKRQELVRDEVKSLREQAKIEFVGEFKNLEKVAMSSDSAASAASEGLTSMPSSVVPAASAPEVDAGSVEKGLSGLR